MSGGFFRGTSADQDTRFSNKKAKLLKSQKFPPELDHLVDVTKVKMDVMRPWIANRATELLGFEDEVLINFIYGLLDGKAVNGKEVQISLTGFMEKNTGKFMKELWSLLLSAQKNASGVPQQFLDAKEEETRKKKAETDRIANEIQKKRDKESRELEQEKMKKMDDDVDISRANNTALDPSSKYQPRAASTWSVDEKETNEANGSRGRSRVSRSPHSAGRSPSPPRGAPSRSISKSFSNSRSQSGERHRSRSVSRSPESRGRSISSERVYRSPPGWSITPRRRHSPRRHVSPTRYRSYHSRRRSMSRSRRRSPSPVRRRRSPLRGTSRSPVRRRSRSPRLYGSWRRSPSPMRRRSPSPIRGRSPSPVRRRYRRSSSTPRRRCPSPTRPRSPITDRRRSPTPPRRRSPLPQYWSSPSPIRRTTPSLIRRKSPKRQRRSPVESPRERIRAHEKYSPVRRVPPGENIELPRENRKRSDSSERRPVVSLRSPQRDLRDQNYSRREVPVFSPPPSESLSISKSPSAARKRSPSKDRRSSSHESSPKQTRERMTHGGSQISPQKPREHKPRHDNPKTSVEKEETNYAREDGDWKFKPSGKGSLHSSRPDEHKCSLEKGHDKDEHSSEKVASHRSGETRNRPGGVELTKKEQEMKSEKNSGRVLHFEVPDRRELLTTYKDTLASERQKESYPREGYKTDEKNHSRSNDVKGTDRRPKSEAVSKLSRKVEEDDQRGSVDSGSEENDKHRYKEKRKHKRSERQEVTSDDDYSYDSEIEEKKEAKRRRKEEKKLKKEERRRRREERRRKREERRAQKLKLKSIDTVTPPSDFERNREDSASEGERAVRRESHASDVEEAESKQKKLEIELREKALESLRAKKGVHH